MKFKYNKKEHFCRKVDTWTSFHLVQAISFSTIEVRIHEKYLGRYSRMDQVEFEEDSL